MDNPKPLTTISYLCLYVSDVAKSAKFYSNILGLEPINSSEDPATSTWYSFKTGQTVLALESNGFNKNGLKTKAENPVLFQFIIETEEGLERFNKYLEEHDVKLFDRSKQTNYGLITNFCDPDGNKLELICQN